MIHVKAVAPLALITVLGACTNSGANYTPVIDGPVGPNYGSDLAQCQSLAASQASVDGGTAGSAVVGAGVGAATSAIINSGSRSKARDAAAVGAIAGVTSDVVQKEKNKEAIVRNCMRGRGYNVVG